MGRSDRFRGKRTHGHGKKATRGAGKRGGRGNAGLHKHKFVYMLKYLPDHFGRHGFKRHPTLTRFEVSINVGDLPEKFGNIIGDASKIATPINLNLSEQGYDKLLGAGKLSIPLNITVAKASKKAIEKIKSAGGKVELNG